MNYKERIKQEKIIKEVRLSVYNSIISDSFEDKDFDEMGATEKIQVITLLHKIEKLDNKIAS